MPALMAAGSIVLAIATITIDKSYLYNAGTRPWLIYSGGPDGARAVLSTIAGSMMTVAGVVFSITIVVLSLASSQFGPRLIRNFMNVKANQMVLGTFVATYMYCILVIHTANATEGARFVPILSVTLGVVLSLVSLGVLIYFIHSVSESIQAENIISRVRHDLDKTVDRIFPDILDPTAGPIQTPIHREYDIPDTCDREVCHIEAARSGYLQAVDEGALMKIALAEDLLIHIGYRPGDFVTQRSTLVTVWPGERIDEPLKKKINAIFIVGSERTPEQDAEFAISQLVEIAVRALSPGINDPITAMTCIDWLGASLCQLAKRKMPASHHYDHKNRLRIISKPFKFEGMVNAALNMIRQNSISVPAVSIKLLETIATVAAQTVREEDRIILRRHAEMVANGCKAMLSDDNDRRDLETRYQAAVAALEGVAR